MGQSPCCIKKYKGVVPTAGLNLIQEGAQFYLKLNNKAFFKILVTHAYNPTYSEGRDQEDLNLKLALANSLGDYLKNTHHRKGKGTCLANVRH
jgi:hypothetical protein